ncbi:MAG: DegT/DnrJ/EryC1/StrS family aminotransferase [Pseudomonadota bacterium]
MSEKLALLGGTPINQAPIPSYNTIGAEEKAAVMEVLDSGELSGFVAAPGDWFLGGKKVRSLENAFCEHFDVKHAIALNSATSGLHAGLMAMDIGPGDEVIVSPYTMHASATMIVMCGAVPVFADIEPCTFCIDPASVEALITPRTRGIVAVNIFGHPAALGPLKAICDRHGLFLIEDNAQAPDATYKGQKTATIGDCGVFSFNRHKTMQCGEGGMIITDDDRIAKKARFFRNHGETVVEALGEEDLVNTLGVNYRMGEMEAAVAEVQFSKLPELNRARQALSDRLTEQLSKIPGITPPSVMEECTHVYYFYVMKYDANAVGIPRDLFVRAFQAEGFPLRAGYLKPLYLEPMYQKRIAIGRHGFPWSAHPGSDNISYEPGICPVVERLQNEEVMLTNYMYPPLSENDMDRYVETFHKVLDNRGELLALARNEAAE